MSAPDDETAPTPHTVGDSVRPSPTQAQDLLIAFHGTQRAARSWKPPDIEQIRRALPQYEITDFIAHGGMGAVFKGVQKTLQRTVAIKVLRFEIEDREMHYADRFKLEARAMAQLAHPGIVAVYDAGETPDGLLYFVMEFVKGRDMGDLINERKSLDPRQAVTIVSTVCDALAYAHENGVIHRDIKPSNIMLDQHGRVKIADFGLAKVTDHDGLMLTRTNLAVGTPDFVAPEALIPGVTVDQRADIYSVGVMLYQMLTGKIPRGRFDPPSRIIPQLDRRVDAIVDRALQSDKDKRYSSALEMRRDLELVAQRLNAGSSTKALAVSPEPGAWWRAPLFHLTSLVAALAMAAMVWSAWTPRPREVDRPAAGDNSNVPVRADRYPAGRWVKAFPVSEAIPGIAQSEDGWLRCNSDAPGVFALSGNGGHLMLRDAAVRARFRGPGPKTTFWAKLEIRHNELKAASSFRYLPPQSDRPAEVRIEMIHENGKAFTTLASAPVEPPIQENEEFTMDLCAIGATLIGRLKQQTLTAQLDGAGARIAGALGIWGADRNFFRDLEVINLDGLPEAEALKLAGADPGRVKLSGTPVEPERSQAEAVWRARWHQPGRLRAAGTDYAGAAFDLRAAEPHADFVQVMATEPARSQGRSWVALRSTGDAVWSDGSVESGRIALVRSTAEVRGILAGGMANHLGGWAPAKPVTDFCFSRFTSLPGSPLVMASTGLDGKWTVSSSAFDAGLMQKPDLDSPPKVTRIVVGGAGTGVLREDGTLRIWNAAEIPLPEILGTEVRTVVPQGSSWTVLKTNGHALIFDLQRHTAHGLESLRGPENIRACGSDQTTEVARGGYVPVLQKAGGRWSVDAPGVVEDVLAKLHADRNESFSVFRGAGKEGILWIEPVK